MEGVWPCLSVSTFQTLLKLGSLVSPEYSEGHRPLLTITQCQKIHMRTGGDIWRASFVICTGNYLGECDENGTLVHLTGDSFAFIFWVFLFLNLMAYHAKFM